MFDQHATKVIEDNINMSVPWYLMCAYAYYVQDDPITSDTFFDNLAKTILNRWDEIEHRHKDLLTKDMLEAGTYIGDYPSIVEGAVDQIKTDRNIKGSKNGKAKARQTKAGGPKLRKQQSVHKSPGRVLPGL